MAVDEESFTTVNGEEITRTSLIEEIINFYTLKREAGDTEVTDFNEGSEIRNLIEGITVDIYYMMEDQQDLTNIAFADTAEGEWLDRHGAKPEVQLPRETGSVASGYVVFSIPSVSSTDVLIPEGTVVYDESGLEFETTGEAYIIAGDTSVTVTVECLTEGEDGNVGTGSITIVDDDELENIVTVNNIEPLTGGVDYEEDDEYRDRLLAHAQRPDFGSLPYYTELAENVDGVHDVTFIQDNIITILVNGDVKPTPESVLADVLDVFTIPSNIILDHTFTVDTPEYVSFELNVELDVVDLVDDTELEYVIYDFVNGGARVIGMEFDGLGIGETLSVSSLESALELFESVTGVRLYDGEMNPLEDVTVEENEVLNLTSLNITQNVIGG